MASLETRTPIQTAPAASSRWRALGAAGIGWRFALFAFAIVVLVTLGQLVEDALDTPILEMVPPNISIPRWTLILLTAYMLVVLRVIHWTALRTLRDIRAAVLSDDTTFEQIRRRMTRPHFRTTAVLALLAVTLVVVLFPLLRAPLPITRNPATNAQTFLPHDPVNALVVLVAYSLVGWAALSLLVSAVRLGYALGDLTRKPLAINIFDTDNLLPLGRLALALSLAPAGVVLILLIGLGTPTRPLAWFAFLLASLASILALLLPLRGVHRQMAHAKNAALTEMNHELGEVHREVLESNEPDGNRTAFLSNRTNILVNLRKVVQEVPTWPFRDTMAVSRALLVASAPLVYTVLNELIRVFVIQPLTK